MNIIFWGTYDKSKPRIRILLKGLNRTTINVKECHFSIWESIQDKSQISSKFKFLVIFLKLLIAYPFLLCKLITLQKPHVLVVAYPAIFDVLFALIYAKIFKIPLVWDVFISLYNTVVEDRKILTPDSILARLIFFLEKFTLNKVDFIILDTKTHATYLAEKYSLDLDKISFAYVGAENEIFPSKKCTNLHSPVRLLFYGQFIPLHGIEKIIQAAEEMSLDEYSWTLIGKGQESERIETILKKKPLKNLKWIRWVNYHNLVEHIHNSDICLGIFGDTIKAQIVIPNKVFQIISAGKPFVTSDTPAMRELFPIETEGLKYAQGNTYRGIIQAITKLQNSYSSLPEDLFILEKKRITPLAIANQYEIILQRLSGLTNEI